MILNDQQEYIVEQGVRFYKYSSEQLFQYDGLPGTGKSVVMMAIADRLVRQEKLLNWREILPMAYTGQAAIVMRTKGFPNARSIHSSIYTPEYMPKTVDGKPVINTKYNIPELQLTMIPKDLSKYKLMLIDEAWMVPRRMKRDIESHGIKIIACGDSRQLPPIADSPAYLVDGKIYHLNQIMRQEEGSGIIYIANRCLQGLPINTGYYGNALVIEMDDLTDDMIANSSIVICGKNATRDTINDRVRHNILHIDSDLPTNGERVICRKNNWGVEIDGISLANGLTGTCISSPRIPSFDGKTFSMDFLPDLCNTPFLDLKCDYQYFIAPAGSKNELKNVPFNTGEKFDLAYSLTTHLAQGAEYSNGIYIEEKLKDPSISKFLNNTGVTRFRNAMIYVKPNRRKLWY